MGGQEGSGSHWRREMDGQVGGHPRMLSEGSRDDNLSWLIINLLHMPISLEFAASNSGSSKEFMQM